MVQFEDLLREVQLDYPTLKIRPGHKFLFRPPHTILFEQTLIGTTFNEQNLGHQAQNSRLPLVQKQAKVEQNYSKYSVNASLEHNNYCLQLLHELGHALLNHRTFATDPERLKMECAAWEKARELCIAYHIYYDEEFVEAELDTYREWLHQKSRCLNCGLTRYQDRNGVYHCPECELQALSRSFIDYG